ncbi:GntR family transcriptional regulator [Compostibacter hankyongensis]|uniref:GntR family transcriptional regulator n=1 Tax=Compostibacter hankyongensis TaxID=1007089 RepID=A0ABP8G927_9BACT
MEFNHTQAIYLQIAEYVCDRIQSGQWAPEDRVPSVRELAVDLEVNPNTVMRAYEYLQQQEIIYTRRGLGYFVGADAVRKLKKIRSEQFFREELPQLFRKIALLDIAWDELGKQYEQFRRKEAGKNR